ncbi:hypothetical protein MMC10_002217 [Thelotrema lepadinum]|nr:hypothetical protein [Thelotrema lepadinum]
MSNFRYLLFKENLDEAIEDLETWQRLADPSWYLLLRIADVQIEQALQESSTTTLVSASSTASFIRDGLMLRNRSLKEGIFLPSGKLKSMEILSLPLSEARLALRTNANKGQQTFILSDIYCPSEDDTRNSIEKNTRENLREDVRDLARRLQHDDPQTLGLLTCKGVIEPTEYNDPLPQSVHFTMVFRTPQDSHSPQSLRDRLISDKKAISLSHKFDIARQIARSVSYIHAFNFVHKNIRPETILVFHDSKSSVLWTYLVGFRNFRKVGRASFRQGDMSIAQNLYRHPDRYGLHLEVDYIMQHDIYSLGVCLLEIGLWESLLIYEEDGQVCVPSAALGSLPDKGLYPPKDLKEKLINLAQKQLPYVMGPKYARVVETCLSCLDPDNSDFGDEHQFLDEDGIRVGVRYIEKVRYRIQARM